MRIYFFWALGFIFAFEGFAESSYSHPESNFSVFSSIYAHALWGQDGDANGTSGSGSDPKNAEVYIEFLQDFLTQHAIQSVIDLGCGDWQISQNIDWKDINYTGIDVAESVIAKNIEKFADQNITFVYADGTNYTLPEADLLICKDVLQHLPFSDISLITEQLDKFKYCLITNDVDPASLTCINKDIPRGGYRLLDVTKSPFFVHGEKILTYISANNTKQVILINNN